MGTICTERPLLQADEEAYEGRHARCKYNQTELSYLELNAFRGVIDGFIYLRAV